MTILRPFSFLLPRFLIGATLVVGCISAQAQYVPPATPNPTPVIPPVVEPTPEPTPEPVDTAVSAPTPGVQPELGPMSTLPPVPSPDVVPSPSPSPTPDPNDAPLTDFPDLLQGDPSLTPQGLTAFPQVQATSQDAASTLRTLEYARKVMKQTDTRKDVPAMTIDDAIQTALQKNPGVLNSVESIRIAQGRIIQVRSRVLPRISFESSYQQAQKSLVGSQSSGPTTFTIPNQGGGDPIQITLPGRTVGNPDKQWSIQFVGRQLLFDGGGAIAGIQAATYAENLALYQLRQVIDQVIADVKINFYLVVLNRSIILAQKQSVALLESQLIDQQNRYEAGTVPRFNVLQAEVALANAIPPLINAQNNLRISEFQLVRLLGMDYQRSRISEVPFNVRGELGYSPRDVNTDNSIRTALERSPTLKAQRQDIMVQAANVTVARSGFFPRLNAAAGYEWRNDQTSSDLSAYLDGAFFGIEGSWALFDGLETYGASKQAVAQLKQSKINYDNSVRVVVLDVQEAVSNLQNARETIESQQASVVQAVEAVRLAQERLNAGAGTQLDVLNAQVALLQAQTTELQARYDYISATAQYDQALSLDTQYEDEFVDPLTRNERRKFDKVNNPEYPQPKLPGKMQEEDPLAGIVTPEPKEKRSKKKSREEAKATPTPAPGKNARSR